MIQSVIELEQMEFFSYHGVMEQERLVGNTFWVDVSLHVDVSKAIQSDCLEDTISYAEVYRLVRQEMEIPSNLLEHVAGRILHSLKTHFPQAGKICISVAKKNPPVGGQTKLAKVTVVSS